MKENFAGSDCWVKLSLWTTACCTRLSPTVLTQPLLNALSPLFSHSLYPAAALRRMGGFKRAAPCFDSAPFTRLLGPAARLKPFYRLFFSLLSAYQQSSETVTEQHPPGPRPLLSDRHPANQCLSPSSFFSSLKLLAVIQFICLFSFACWTLSEWREAAPPCFQYRKHACILIALWNVCPRSRPCVSVSGPPCTARIWGHVHLTSVHLRLLLPLVCAALCFGQLNFYFASQISTDLAKEMYSNNASLLFFTFCKNVSFRLCFASCQQVALRQPK